MNSNSQLPFLSIKLENDRPVKVVKFFSSQGVQLIHELDYPDENTIRVDLTRIASDGNELYVGYSNYHQDSNGNVVHNERFTADQNNPENVTKLQDLTFSYDTYESPQKGLYLPFFNNPNFPEVQFFSANNIISAEDSTETFNYENEYGPDDQLVTQKQPGGRLVLFRYVNCEL